MDMQEMQASIVQTLAVIVTQQRQMTEMQVRLSEHMISLQNKEPAPAVPPTGSSHSVNAFKFTSFDESVESFADFLDRLEAHFALHNVSEANKIGCFVAALPPKLFKLLKNLVYPETYASKTYLQIRTLLKDHLNPVPLVIPSRHALFTRRQQEGESITAYVTELQRRAADCKYTAEILAVVLRDVFVSGLRSKNILDRLFQEDDPSFAEVVQIALSIERAEGATHDVLSQMKVPPAVTPVETVNRVQASPSAGAGYRGKPRRRSTRRNRSGDTNEKSTVKPSAKSPSRTDSPERCYACGEEGHRKPECKKKNLYCEFCKMDGHIDKVCFAQQKPKSSVKMVETDDEFPYEDFTMYRVTEKVACTDDKILVRLAVEGCSIIFELDSGSKRTVINEKTFKQLNSAAQLREVTTVLIDYSNNRIRPIGEVQVNVRDGRGRTQKLPLLVVADRPNLVGRDWMTQLGWLTQNELRFQRATPHDQQEPVHQTETLKIPERVAELRKRFSHVFEPSVGKAKQHQCSLELKPGAKPVFRKARPVPFALKAAIEDEIRSLVKDGVWQPVTTSEWATPIVPVVKSVGVRLCGDYSSTVNPHLKVAQHPFPAFDEVFASLVGGQEFTTLDMKAAFLHLPVDEESAQIQTLNTHMGLFRANRLMYGVSSAPALWQKYVDSLFAGVPCCVVHDDIIITGATEKEHLERLERVLSICSENGLRVNERKCKFFQPEVEFLGFKISKRGVHKTREKVEAILGMPPPRNVTEVKSFLGLVTFYGRFVPGLATMAQPLYALTQKETEFEWTEQHSRSFTRIKTEIASDRVLMGYDPNLPLVLAVDASPVGLGAVLFHRLPSGEERPIAFASRTLNSAEKRYSQIDKEALAIRWGAFKFYHYIYGVRFTLITDHQPLTHIFNANKRLPQLSATRMLHYATELRLFNFDIRYRRSHLHGNADCLSRLPSRSEELGAATFSLDTVARFQVNQFKTLPVTARQVATATAQDPELRPLLQELREGKKAEYKDTCFSILGNIIFYGARIFIPTTLRTAILEDLHVGHFGIVKMKSLARSYVYWPKMEADIERVARSCPHCVQTLKTPPKTAVHAWIPAEGPWQRIHIDFAEYKKQSILVIVDAYSKWPEMFLVSNQLTRTVIDILNELFSRYGLPRTLVSDNGPQFTAMEFQDFLKQREIVHKTSAPFHPATNGQAERYVGTVKNALKTMDAEYPGAPLSGKLRRFLFAYRRMPHTTTNESPAKLFLGRELRSSLDLVRPPVKHGCRQQLLPTRMFAEGERVAVRNYANPNKRWLLGTVVSRDGPVSYTVDVGGMLHRRHTDQIRAVSQSLPPSEPESYSRVFQGRPARPVDEPASAVPHSSAPPLGSSPAAPSSSAVVPGVPEPPASDGFKGFPATPVGPRRSTRPRKPPLRFSP